MKAGSLLLLRISLGLLMVLWGIDKLVNTKHGLLVSAHFYLDLFTSPLLLKVFGVAQILLGVAVLLGIARRVAYPVLLVITAVTLLGVWRSIVDPWGWYLEGSNVLFYPSLIIFAGAWILHAFRSDDRLSVDENMQAARA